MWCKNVRNVKEFVSAPRSVGRGLRGITEKLKMHFKPEPLIIYERYIFGKRLRKTDERIADFAVDLKRLSASCKFGNFLDEAICMQFVVGLSMSKIKSRLMQKSTLAFEAAVKIAIAEHAATTSCAKIEPSTSRDSADRGSVHHLATKHAKPSRVNKMCWRCGNVTTHPITAVLNRRHVTDAIKSGMFINDVTPSESGLWTTRKHRLQCITCTKRQITTSSMTWRKRHVRVRRRPAMTQRQTVTMNATSSDEKSSPFHVAGLHLG